MGIYLFTKKLFKSEKKENLCFTGVVVIISICLFNIINMIYNYNIYPEGESVIRDVPMPQWSEDLNQWSTIDVPQRLTVDYVMRENILYLLIFSTAVIILCNLVYIKNKSQDIAFIIYSGGTFVDALRFLIYTNFKSCLGGAFIGAIIGGLISPIVNIILYWAMGVTGPIFFFDAEVIIVSIIYCFLQYTIIIMLNIGYVYRNDIVGLLNSEKTKRLDDKRGFKIPSIIYILIFLAPVLYMFTLPEYKGADDVVYYLAIISTCSVFYINYAKEDIFRILKRGEFLYKKNRMIYLSNGLSNLKDLIAFIVLFILSVLTLMRVVIELYDVKGMRENILIALIIMCMIIAVGIVYKCLIAHKNVILRVKQLDLLGYNEKEILKIVKKEFLVVFSFVIIFPIIIILSNVIVYVTSNACTLSYGIALILVVSLPVALSGILFLTYCIKDIKKKFFYKEKLEEERSELVIEGEF